MPRSNDPHSCSHARDVPNICPCPPGCYCKGRNCSLATVPEWRVVQSGMARFPGPELIVLDIENMGGFHVTETWCNINESALRGCAVFLALPIDFEERLLNDAEKYWLKQLRAWPWVKGEFRKGKAMTAPASWVTAFQEAWFKLKNLRPDGVPKKARGRAKSSG